VAIVDFAFPVDDRISAEHRAIIAGASIGQTFRDSGWRIEKETLVISETGPEEYAWGIAGLMRIDSKQPLAIHRYRFVVAKGRLKIYYASITEIHHPEYMNVRQLRAIF
jgi:hypothetical protein